MMRLIPPTAGLALLLLLIASLAADPPSAGGGGGAGDEVKLAQKDNHVAVTIGGEPFTDYYFAEEGGRPYVRPFMYPVRAADGTVVTSDQLQSGGDHPHHRSLYVAHGDVNGADHWSLNQ